MNMRRINFAAALAAIAVACAPSAFSQTASCVQGRSGVAPAATLTFTPPTTNTDGTPVVGPLTYEILQGPAAASLAVAAKGLAGSPITVNTGLGAGATVYFAVVAVDAKGNASAQSNVVCKTFPASIPSAISITIT